MKINIMKFLAGILIFTSLSCITPRQNLYYDALNEARDGNIDFAFMKLNNYLREYPESSRTKGIKFAIAEYHFQIQDYREAIYELSEYIQTYPQDKSAVFAYALLYKSLLDFDKEPLLVEKIKEQFFSKSLFLMFSDAKIQHYKSILKNTYKIAEYVDKIEFFKNDELFLKITP